MMRPDQPDTGAHPTRPAAGGAATSIAGSGAGKASAPRPGVGGVAWRLHREVVLLLGWGRALLLQLAHPLVASGVADHSSFRTGRWGRLSRLHRTLDAMLTLTFGTEEEVAGVARGINAIHDRVHGRLREGTGAFASGTPYSAHDPALLQWVHATLVDSHLLAYELFVGPLTAEEKDRYCAETCSVEALLGIPEGRLPRSVAELRGYLDGMLASGEIAVTGTARALAREIVSPAVPWPARPLFAAMRLPTVGLLPPAIREAYGFPWGARRARALRLWARVMRALLPWVPSLLRYWPRARAGARAGAQGGVGGQAPGTDREAGAG